MQFADRIHDKHAVAAGRVRTACIDVRLQDDLKIPCLQFRPDTRDVRGIARHHDESKARMVPHQRPITCRDGPVLAIAQAPADDDHVLRGEVQCAPRIGRSRPGRCREIVFHVPGHRDARLRNTQPKEPGRVRVALHGDQRHLSQQMRHQARSGVNSTRPFGHLAVDDRHRDAPRVSCEQEIGPEIRFHDNHQPWVVAAQETAHHETQIRRKVDHACIRIVLLRRGKASGGIGGNHHRRRRILCREAPDQRPQQRDLAR